MGIFVGQKDEEPEEGLFVQPEGVNYGSSPYPAVALPTQAYYSKGIRRLDSFCEKRGRDSSY